MKLKIMADFQPPPTLFDVQIYANPAGSRNLEFDPKKQIRWIEQTGIMQYKRVISYIVGTLLFVFGVAGLGIEIELGNASSDGFVIGFVMPAISVACGVLIYIATWLRYGGGLWFVFGVAAIGIALMATVGLIGIYLQGQHLQSVVASYSRMGAAWIIGAFCLAMGHIAHRKNRRSPS
jgi:hypothetical protein